MRVKYLFILLVIFLFTCEKRGSKNEEIESCLTGGDEKYWTVMKENGIKRNTGILFKSNGKYINYHVKNFKEVGVRLISKNYEKPFWSLKGDDTLCISGINYKVEYINQEILIINNLKVRGLAVFYKAIDQQTKPVRDTTKYLYPDL